MAGDRRRAGNPSPDSEVSASPETRGNESQALKVGRYRIRVDRLSGVGVLERLLPVIGECSSKQPPHDAFDSYWSI